VVVLLLTLAVYRVTRLIVADGITDPWREWVEDRTGEDSSWSYLAACPWCVSVYVGAALTAATCAAGAHGLADVSVPVPFLVWPATSALTGLIAANLDPE
jgi:hypothetical protein